MSVEKNQDLLERFGEALNKNEVGVNHEFWTKDMVWRGPAGLGVMHGVDAFEEQIRKPFIHAFPDKVSHNEAHLVTEDYAASAGYQLTTHAKEWLGIPPSGKQIKVHYMDIWRIEEEDEERKLAENWVMIDILGVLEQTGYDIKKVLKFIGSKPPEFFDEVE